MPEPGRTILPGLLLGLLLALAFPSAAIVEKYFGLAGVLVYWVGVAAILYGGYHTYPRWSHLITERRAMWLAAATLLAVGILFAVIYPIANAPAPQRGSDNDDAIVLGVQALMQGRNPYQERTYLGNPVNSMLGGFLLAAPFVWLDNGALQNLFWLVLFWAAMRFYLRGWRGALLLLWCLLGLAPLVLYSILIGDSKIANTLYILLTILILMVLAPQSRRPLALKIALAALLGVALASRANFLGLTPLLFASIGYRSSWRLACGLMAVVLAVFGALNLPLYLLDPAGFMPIVSGNVLARFRPILPHADTIIIGLTGIVSLALAVRPANRSIDCLFVHCAVVLTVPVICGVILVSVATGHFTLSFAHYGIFALFFGATGSWAMLWRSWVSGQVAPQKVAD